MQIVSSSSSFRSWVMTGRVGRRPGWPHSSPSLPPQNPAKRPFIPLFPSLTTPSRGYSAIAKDYEVKVAAPVGREEESSEGEDEAAHFLEDLERKYRSVRVQEEPVFSYDDLDYKRRVGDRNLIKERVRLRLTKLTDLTRPQFWYPAARGMKRKLILHIGPTNSGKTHSAISVLSKAKSAVYCAPLRLLAGEVWEKLNTQYQVPCDLVTGQQCIEVPGSSHVSCTIEMVDITKPVDVAIIDEYQLISDEKRGWAWTKALLGLPAKEIHLTGDTSRIELIKHLCSLTGDELEVQEYQRLSPLAAESNSVKSLKSIKEGDAVIVFSRKQVYEIKKEIEKVRNMKCCIVYGSLPPEARSEQAKLFNDQNSEFKILVGTDCIGLGLNLNIRRIVFASCQKFDGNVTRKLTPSEIRQIAGRAGRFKSVYPEGYVSSFDKNDLFLIKRAIEHKEPEEVTSHKAVVFPNFEQFSMFSDALGGDTPFSEIIHAFVSRAKVAHYFTMACHLNMYDQACSIDHIPLDIEERYTFCLAPVDTRIHRILKNFIRFADDFCSRKSVPFRIYSRFNDSATTPDRLEQLEIDYKIAELYLWLANRFPDKFTDKPRAEKYLEDVTQFINQTLSEDTTVKSKKKRTKSKRS